MTLKALIQSDVTEVFMNTSDFAEQVIRWKCGDSGNRQAVTAVVIFEDVDFKRDSRGRGYHTRGKVLVDDSVTINNGDAVQVRGERYDVLSVDVVDNGLREVTVVRYDSEARGVRTADI